MKRLLDKIIDPLRARFQHGELNALLDKNKILDERKHVLPFFSARQDICMLFAHYIPGIKAADCLALEFKIYGDFVTDLIVGDRKSGKYLLVEFEDGTPHSIFASTKKTTPDWAKRFEGGFSQLVDWLWKLEDMRVTTDFAHVFGRRDVSFSGLIVLGKEMNLAAQEEARLKWRQDKVLVDSKGISVLSYEDFLQDADHWLTLVHRV